VGRAVFEPKSRGERGLGQGTRVDNSKNASHPGGEKIKKATD